MSTPRNLVGAYRLYRAHYSCIHSMRRTAAAALGRHTLRDFADVYRLYRRHHPFGQAVSRAWRIAVQRLPF